MALEKHRQATVVAHEGTRMRTGATSRRVMFEVLDRAGDRVTFVVSGLAYEAMSQLKVGEDGAEAVIRELAPDIILRAHERGDLDEDGPLQHVDGETVVLDITPFDLPEG